MSGNPTQKRSFLAELRTDVKARPTAMIAYGVPGVGKTSMAANAPGAVFLTDSAEDGITTLKSFGRVPQSVPQLPPARTWSDVMGTIDELATAEHPYKCLVLDAMGGIERLCHEEVCRRDYNNVWGEKGFGSYQRGVETSLADWRQLINALDRLRDAKQMSVIVLAHSKVQNFKNPEGPDFDRYLPDCNPKTWALTHKWADMVLFLNYIIVVDKDGKGQGGQDRTMFTQYHPAYDAKNRHGLPDMIPMGESGREAWANLTSAIQSGKAGISNG
jgi:hypothetical protein